MTTQQWPDDNIILYDGICIFCSRWVRFVAARDGGGMFRFTAIQSDYGRRLATNFGIDPGNPDTNAVVHNGVVYFKSDAALIVLGNLPHWRWSGILIHVPKLLRDMVYDVIARNRYLIFGTYNECFLGDPSFKARIFM